MEKYFSRFVLIIVVLLSGILSAQENSSDEEITDPMVLGFRVHHGYLFAHSVYVKKSAGSEPSILELDLGWIQYNDDTWKDCHFYPKFGMILSATSMKKPFLGYSYSWGLYIQPNLMERGLITPYYRAGAGLSYMTHPYDKKKNDDNRSYATHFNFYLFMALGLQIDLDDHWGANLAAYFNHMSNAGYKEPNGGINFPSLSLGVDYNFTPVDLKPRNVLSPYDMGVRKVRHDVSGYIGWAAIAFPDKGQFPMFGLTYRYSHQISRYGALAVGTEFEYNGRVLQNKKLGNIEQGRDHRRVSVFTGYEFLMGRTIFSIVFGTYIYRPVAESVSVYQKYQLVYRIFPNIYAGVSFKSFGHVADYNSGTIIYSF